MLGTRSAAYIYTSAINFNNHIITCHHDQMWFPFLSRIGGRHLIMDSFVLSSAHDTCLVARAPLRDNVRWQITRFDGPLVGVLRVSQRRSPLRFALRHHVRHRTTDGPSLYDAFRISVNELYISLRRRRRRRRRHRHPTGMRTRPAGTRMRTAGAEHRADWLVG